jgi:N-acetylglucosaminyl-diphospho-decaprenol L-rhamnosyltransferase
VAPRDLPPEPIATAEGIERLLTVSLVSHQQGDLAQRALDGLARADARLTKTIVTRNLPESWTPRWEHPQASLVVVDNPQPKGFGANHNAAFVHCTTPFFAVVNPDLSFAEANLPDILPLFDDPRLGAATPTVLNPAGEKEDIARDLMSLPNLVRRHLGRPPGTIAWVAGICLVLRSDAFRMVGGFDERYYMYCEDADLCGRLALAGWHFAIDPMVRVVHDARRQSLRKPRHFLYHVDSLLRYWAGRSFWAQRRLLAERSASTADGLDQQR